jgi:hypothetical protein
MRHILLFAATLMSGWNCFAQAPEFYWLSPKTDTLTYRTVETAFADELRPDQPGTTGNYVPMTVKSIARVGMFDGSALVLLEYQEDANDKFPTFRAFTFHPATGDKATVQGMKDSDSLSLWRFERVAHFENKSVPDIVFTYFSCTECEASRFLASFYYDPGSKSWQVRHWSEEDGDALLVGSDDQMGDLGVYSYSCLHIVGNAAGGTLDEVAVRCRESFESDKGKKIDYDDTLLYAAKTGHLARSIVRKSDPRYQAIQTALCKTKPKSPLCSAGLPKH